MRILLTIFVPLVVTALPLRNGTTTAALTVVAGVEALVTTPAPSQPVPVSPSPTTATTTFRSSMRPKKIRVRKIKSTTTSPSYSDSKCACDCSQVDSSCHPGNNGTDKRISLKKGPSFYRTATGKSADGQRLRRNCCGCGCGRRCCCCGGGGGGGGGCCCDCCGCCGCCMPCCDMQPRPCMCCPQRRCFRGCGCCCNRCCPYCNFCCNGMRPAGQGKRKKREVTTPSLSTTEVHTTVLASMDSTTAPTKAEIESAASPTHAAAAAALHVSAPTARSQAKRKMLAESQRAFVKRAKRQNSRNREVRQYPMCPCAWCNSRSVDNNRTPHSPRDREPQRTYARSGAPAVSYGMRDDTSHHADYSRSGAHPDNYPRGSRGNSSPCHSPRNTHDFTDNTRGTREPNNHHSSYGHRDRNEAYARSGAPLIHPRGNSADYPDYTSPDRPRFRSYASASAPQDRADAGTRYGKPYELSARTDNNQYPNDDEFTPRVRMPQGGPVRGSGPFARALQMSSPLSWMRTWLTDQVRMRNGMLGYGNH